MKSFAPVVLIALALSLPAQQNAPQQKAQPKAPAAPVTPAEPREVRDSAYTYDVNGRPVLAPSSQQERKGAGAGAVVDRQEVMRDSSGQPIAVRKSEERVLSEQEGDKTSERVIQRYDLTGRPTTKQVIKLEKRKMPDGSVVSTENFYEQDVNGRLQFAERRTSTEKKTDAGGGGTLVVERPSVNGGVQVVERTNRTDTKRGDAVTESVTSKQMLDGNGRLTERERGSSVATKSGDATTTETSQWQLGGTGQMEFLSRTVSRISEKPDGSQVEDREVYSTRIAGTTPDLNHAQTPSLEEQVHRERKVRPDGKIVESTTARMRQVAEPTRLGGLMVTEQVTTPTADGKSIQRTVSERDANGRVVPVRREVEEEKK